MKNPLPAGPGPKRLKTAPLRDSALYPIIPPCPRGKALKETAGATLGAIFAGITLGIFIGVSLAQIV